jgi:hypothetical protein
MVYTPSADALQLLRVMLDTPSDEGNERARTEVPGDPGGDWGREDGLGGGRPVAGEPANGSRVAGPVQAGGTGRTGGPVAPTGEQPPPDVGRGRGDGARAAAITSVLGAAAGGGGAGAQTGGAGAVGVGSLPLPGPRWSHRPGGPAPPARDMEALGASPADGALADGRGRRLSPGRWDRRQSLDRD